MGGEEGEGAEWGMTGWEAGGTSKLRRCVGVGGEVSESVGGVGRVGWWVCDKVIKTFHDIRVCEVPRADH